MGFLSKAVIVDTVPTLFTKYIHRECVKLGLLIAGAGFLSAVITVAVWSDMRLRGSIRHDARMTVILWVELIVFAVGLVFLVFGLVNMDNSYMAIYEDVVEPCLSPLFDLLLL